MLVGYHGSHEQFGPVELLEYVQRAEQAGFQAAMCSDHYNPWSARQGNSGYTWSWLGAALEATRLTLGCVSAPCYRYHPAVLAQKAATLAAMYPGRFWVALGSGERLNEDITGEPWPSKDVRAARYRESALAIRRLLAGDEVTHDGAVRIERARLWAPPSPPPAVYAAALSEPTARDVAEWADGLILAVPTPEDAQPLIEAYRGGGGRGPVLVQLVVSYAATDDAAVDAAYDQWRQVALSPEQLADLATPEAFEAATAGVTREQVAERVLCAADLARHRERLEGFAALDVHTVYVHNVSRDQRAFIEAYAREVLPRLASGTAA